MKRIEEKLPEIYQKFLPDFFKSSIQDETSANCSNCPMLPGPSDRGSVTYYNSSFKKKCCTYYPSLPNYLVGAILNNNEPTLKEGQNRIRKKIKAKIEVKPHGIRLPNKYILLKKHAQDNFFGNSQRLICPYYEKEVGICTILPYRDTTCYTWFCKFVAGHDGREFWFALKKYMKYVEESLVQYTLYKMGFNSCDIIFSESSDPTLTVEELDDQPPNQVHYQDLWGEWFDREVEFYINSYNLIKALKKDDFDHIAGITQSIILDELKNKHHNLFEPDIPDKLRRNPYLRAVKTNSNSYIIAGYSNSDSLEVSKELYEILDYFDGKHSNEDIYNLLRKQNKTVPAEDLLLKLYQFRILLKSVIE